MDAAALPGKTWTPISLKTDRSPEHVVDVFAGVLSNGSIAMDI
jgi:hypothetical protein